MRFLAAALCALAVSGCAELVPSGGARYLGRIHREHPALDRLIAPDTVLERLAEGFQWSEGPVWIDTGGFLLFSDVPANSIYRWSEQRGISVFLHPSGYTGPNPAMFREPGTNGLIRGSGNSLLMADHGNRAVTRLDLATKRRTFLVTGYQGKRFNSPNDLTRASSGAIYFTDPPYGLAGLNRSPHKELPFNGVYRLDPSGAVALLYSSLSFPNGIALSPDEKTLYVSNSDPRRAVIMAFDLDTQGLIIGEHLFTDMTAMVRADTPGVPDGMAIDRQGNLYATGPGGVHVFAPDGTRLGWIETGTAVANCAFGEDGRTLFLASDHMLVRLRTRALGVPK